MCLLLNNSVVNSPLITITPYLLYLNGYLLNIAYVKKEYCIWLTTETKVQAVSLNNMTPYNMTPNT